MGLLLSSTICPGVSLSWPGVGAMRRRYGKPDRLGTRTGQGRQPRSGRAQARALTRSIPSPLTKMARWPRRGVSERSLPRARKDRAGNLVFGGAVKARDHDAAMRIGGEAPGRRDHSVERRKPGTSLGTPLPRILIGSSPVSGKNTRHYLSISLHRVR